MKSKLFLTANFIFLFVLTDTAQVKELNFKNFTQEEGLPSNESYFIYPDSKSYIWIATDQGVVRYNGSKMEHFTLPDNVIFKIREDSKGRIWFFSRTGKLAYFFKEAIVPYKYNDSITKNIQDILITDAYVNDSDEIILNASGGKNYKILKSGKIIKINYARENSIDSCTTIITQINNKDFFASYKIFNQLNFDPLYINIITANTNLKYKVPVPKEYYQHYGCIRNGSFFLFAGKMLVKMNLDGSFKTRLFPSNILCIQSSGENIWVGLLKKGAVLLNDLLEEIDSSPVLNKLSITSIANDYESGTWFSSLENGVYYLKNLHVYNVKGDSIFSAARFSHVQCRRYVAFICKHTGHF